MKRKSAKNNQQTNDSFPPAHAGRPPIVAVLGHVDHGKTTLLDYIRKSNVASREHGGITQHIGAYQIEVKNRLITFIDTPGHEAFAQMRSRGASAADIAILVVAADDSVKPQTRESIEQIKAAKIPMIVAINKVDLPGAKIDRVKQDLAKAGVQVEGFGGDVPSVPVSAKAGTGVPELLDMVLLLADMNGLVSEPHVPFAVMVIETRVDKGKGIVATVIVQKGTLTDGGELFEGSTKLAKVRAIFDEHGQRVREAPPSKPVEVLGFIKNPQIGQLLTEVSTQEVQPAQFVKTIQEVPDFLKPVDEQKLESLTIILKADTAGSLEAVSTSLNKRVNVISHGIGDISDADILLAKSSGAIVIGFNVSCRTPVAMLAQTEKVIFRTYTLIYELLEELTEVVRGLKEVLAVERELGMGQIIAEFPFEKDRIAGTKVTSGRLARGDSVKVMRDKSEIGRAKIKSLRFGKEDITKVEQGKECGILFDQIVDFTLGDAIIAVTIG